MIVNVCYQSLKHYLKDRDIFLLTHDTIHDYVSLPDFIEERRKRGSIPMSHYTGLLRSELLLKHGGTWIDATVLCTGNAYPKEIFDAYVHVSAVAKR